jgi:heterodisulfide reductase subunit D
MALEDYEFGARYCVRCSLCKWLPVDFIKSWRYAKNCPAIGRYDFHTYSGGGRVVTALSLLQKRGDISEEIKEVIYRCQLCGACQTTCHLITELVDPLEISRELKFRCVEEGMELPALAAIKKRTTATGNSFGKSQAGRRRWSKGLGLRDASREGVDVLFFAGCRVSFDESFWPVARGSVELLQKAGLRVGILGAEETCCGGRLFDMGYRKELSRCARSLLKKVSSSSAGMLVTPCACCYGTFKQAYPMMGHDFKDMEVLHITEILDRLIQSRKLKPRKKVPMRVAYHDPCHLGRLGEEYEPWDGEYHKELGVVVVSEPQKPVRRGTEGVFEPPRNTLNSIPGLELLEMERRKEYAWCCGAGGGVLEAYPEFADWTASDRMEEAMSTGCEALVTACPWCETTFKRVAGKGGENGLRILDVVELVRMAV